MNNALEIIAIMNFLMTNNASNGMKDNITKMLDDIVIYSCRNMTLLLINNSRIYVINLTFYRSKIYPPFVS